MLLLLLACATRTSPAVARLFAVLDRDHDGILGAAELDAQASPTLDWRAWDRDGDGGVSPAELAALVEGVNPVLAWRRTPDGVVPAGAGP